MKTFRTYNLAIDFYNKIQALKLKGHLMDQLLRAASSIALNLAEGRGRETLKDQKRFFTIALGSLRECQAVFDLGGLRETPEWSLLDQLAAHLYCLIRKAG